MKKMQKEDDEAVPGIVFDPYDTDLFDFLVEKLKGKELEPQVQRMIKELDVYGEKEPWKLMMFENKINNSTQSLYAFTRLKKINKSMFKRTAGCGTWVIQKTEDVSDCLGNLIGFKKLLIFVEGKKNNNKNPNSDSSSSSRATANNGHWIMHEFSTATQHLGKDSYVICKIRNKDMDASPTKASSSRSSRCLEENRPRPPKRPRVCDSDAPKTLESAAGNRPPKIASSFCCLEENRPPKMPRISDSDAPKMVESGANNDQNSVSLCNEGDADHGDVYSGLMPISDAYVSLQDNNYVHNFYLHQEATFSSCNDLAFDDILNPSTFNMLQQSVASSVCPSGLLMPMREGLTQHHSSWEFMADDQGTKASFTESLRMVEEQQQERLEKLLQVQEHTCQYIIVDSNKFYMTSCN